eukprot:Hpha_TRINITY_DN3362_c0_g1::TRINITY_DN3362_c0_g1_i1::g.172293::m.172293
MAVSDEWQMPLERAMKTEGSLRLTSVSAWVNAPAAGVAVPLPLRPTPLSGVSPNGQGRLRRGECGTGAGALRTGSGRRSAFVDSARLVDARGESRRSRRALMRTAWCTTSSECSTPGGLIDSDSLLALRCQLSEAERRRSNEINALQRLNRIMTDAFAARASLALEEATSKATQREQELRAASAAQLEAAHAEGLKRREELRERLLEQQAEWEASFEEKRRREHDSNMTEWRKWRRAAEEAWREDTSQLEQQARRGRAEDDQMMRQMRASALEEMLTNARQQVAFVQNEKEGEGKVSALRVTELTREVAELARKYEDAAGEARTLRVALAESESRSSAEEARAAAAERVRGVAEHELGLMRERVAELCSVANSATEQAGEATKRAQAEVSACRQSAAKTDEELATVWQRLGGAEAEVRSLQASIAAREAELERLREEKKLLDDADSAAELKRARAAMQQQASELAAVQRRARELEEGLATSTATCAVQEEEVKTLRSAKLAAVSANQQASTAKQAAEGLVEELRSELQLKTHLSEKQHAQITQLRAELRSGATSLEDLRMQLRNSAASAKEKAELTAESAGRADKLETHNSELRERLRTQASHIRELEAKLREAEATRSSESADLSANLTAAEVGRQRFEQEAAALSESLRGAQSQRVGLEGELAALRLEVQSLQAQDTELRATLNTQETHLRAELSGAEERVAGLKGEVAAAAEKLKQQTQEAETRSGELRGELERWKEKFEAVESDLVEERIHRLAMEERAIGAERELAMAAGSGEATRNVSAAKLALELAECERRVQVITEELVCQRGEVGLFCRDASVSCPSGPPPLREPPPPKDIQMPTLGSTDMDTG